MRRSNLRRAVVDNGLTCLRIWVDDDIPNTHFFNVYIPDRFPR